MLNGNNNMDKEPITVDGLKKIQNDLKMQIELKDELASKLKEDKLHFMGLVQEN